MIRLFISFIVIALFSLPAVAEQGVTAEIGTAAGYVYQGEHTQFKFLANYTRSSDASYQDTAAVKISLVQDFATIEDQNIYAGLGYWENLVTRNFDNYLNRIDGIIGVRHSFGKHVQIEAFVNIISYLDGGVVTENVDPNTGSRTRQIGQSGWAFARTGAVAVSYFF